MRLRLRYLDDLMDASNRTSGDGYFILFFPALIHFLNSPPCPESPHARPRVD